MAASQFTAHFFFAMTNEKTIEILNELRPMLTKAYDAEEGYATASEQAGDCFRLVAFFQRQRDLRACLAEELKSAITRLGGTSEEGSSMTAKAHQVWMAVKDFVTEDGEEEAVLKECERGEEAAIREYDDALENHDLSSEAAKLLRNQRSQIGEALGFIRSKITPAG